MRQVQANHIDAFGDQLFKHAWDVGSWAQGGNTYQVQFDGKGTNLHRVWDSGMLLTRGLDWQAYAQTLDARGTVQLPSPIAPLDNPYAQWAEESCAITAEPGFYPADHKINQAYVDAELPVAELRLREAGRRLAEVLNRTLQGTAAAPASNPQGTRQ